MSDLADRIAKLRERRFESKRKKKKRAQNDKQNKNKV